MATKKMARKVAKKRVVARKKGTRKDDGGVKDGGDGYCAEYAGQVEMLCRLGAGDEEMAGFFGVGVEVLERWKREQGEFAEAVRRGVLLADAEVADRLFLRARGFTREGMRVMSRGGKEAPTVVACEEYYPPDVRACIFWLKNRRPDLWREKVVEDEGEGEVVEVKLGDGVEEKLKEMFGVAKDVVGPGIE